MARRPWTEVEMERLRLGYRRLEAVSSIAADLGRNENQVRLAAQRNGLAGKRRMAAMVGERMRKVFADPSSDHAKKFLGRSNTPEARAKRSKTMLATMSLPGVRARVAHQRRQEADKRRGFKVPARMWAEYQRLLGMGFSAQEAGAILGLIPQTHEARGGR